MLTGMTGTDDKAGASFASVYPRLVRIVLITILVSVGGGSG